MVDARRCSPCLESPVDRVADLANAWFHLLAKLTCHCISRNRDVDSSEDTRHVRSSKPSTSQSSAMSHG